jgi:hypothetical protein
MDIYLERASWIWGLSLIALTICGLKQTAAARRAGYSNRGHAANRSA